MAFRLKRNEPVFDGVRRIAREQLAKALAEVDDAKLSTATKVHQIRKRCKKLRGLVRLVRPGFDSYKEENTWFRDTARLLATARDSKIMLDAYDHVFEHSTQRDGHDQFRAIRRTLRRAHQELISDADELDQELHHVRERLSQAQRRIAGWNWDQDEASVLWSGLSRSYRRGRSSMPSAEDQPTPSQFHEWRRHVKYHWYHIRLLRNAWPPMFDIVANVAQKLGDHLGVDHDLHVLQSRISKDTETYGEPADVQAFVSLIERRRRKLERKSLQLGQRLFCEKPARLVDRWQCYWNSAGQ